MPLSPMEREAFSRLGIDASEAMSGEEFYRSAPVRAGKIAQARLVAEALPWPRLRVAWV